VDSDIDATLPSRLRRRRCHYFTRFAQPASEQYLASRAEIACHHISDQRIRKGIRRPSRFPQETSVIGSFDSSDSVFFRVSRQHESFQEGGIRNRMACHRRNLDSVESSIRQFRQPLPNRFGHNPRHWQRWPLTMPGCLSPIPKGGERCGSLRRIKGQS
jgi:hypothetical protein